MDFYEALKYLGENERCGIQCEKWQSHPTKRFLYRTGVDRSDMFGLKLYDFVWEKWYRTWSVFLPTWEEVYSYKWRVVTEEEFEDTRKNNGNFNFLDRPEDHEYIGLLTFFHKEDELKSWNWDHFESGFLKHWSYYGIDAQEVKDKLAQFKASLIQEALAKQQYVDDFYESKHSLLKAVRRKL
jgi:hypothetical protein